MLNAELRRATRQLPEDVGHRISMPGAELASSNLGFPQPGLKACLWCGCLRAVEGTDEPGVRVRSRNSSTSKQRFSSEGGGKSESMAPRRAAQYRRWPIANLARHPMSKEALEAKTVADLGAL